MDFNEVLEKRYSCKKFNSRELSDDLLGEILSASSKAPTAKNLQEHRIYVIKSAEGLKAVDNCTPCRYGAPTVLLVTFDKENVYTYPGGKYSSGEEDAAIVTTYLTLAATNVGVNSCWVNCFDPDKLTAELKLPENEQPLMLLDLGYAADGSGPLENHFKRKELSEVVKII